jgi:amidophosphoribosyltransferase
MGGFFATALKSDAVFDLFYGTDYHSHLGTRRAGMVVHGRDGFNRAIHNIENAPFRSKFGGDVHEMEGNLGIGCISDYDPQPLLVRSHHGTYAITCVGKINNTDELVAEVFKNGGSHFQMMSSGEVNKTELTAALINQEDNIIEGIKHAQDRIDGSMTIILLTQDAIYLARDKFGRTPVVLGRKEGEGYCAAFESFSYLNLGYKDYRELGPGEIDVMTPDGVTIMEKPGEKMRICTFLWVYYGYPSARYEGVSVEEMRYKCGEALARRDGYGRDQIDAVAGVPDSGTAHAMGYANESGVPFSRPFIKYTPTWPRSFMPTHQDKRNLIAKMKLIPVHELIDGKKLLLIDDSIVRGTQLRETTEFLYESGASEVHIRPACPPLLFGCKYINFSRSNSEMELIARRVIAEEEGENVERTILDDYANPDSDRYHKMVEKIRQKLNFTTLAFNRLDDMIEATGIDREKLCTYCWDGRE